MSRKAKKPFPLNAGCALLLVASISVSAESSELSAGTLDLSGLSSEDRGRANVLICLVECARDSSLDMRYQRTRYDLYYETESGFTLSDPTDPDSEVVTCSEMSCEPPPRASAIRSICWSRINRFNDYGSCAWKCTSLGTMYDDELFENEPFATYKQDATNNIQNLCEHINAKPFSDYESTCPQIAFTSGDPVDCSALSDILESDRATTPRFRGVNLDTSVPMPIAPAGPKVRSQ